MYQTREASNFKTPEKAPFTRNKTLKETFNSNFKDKFDLNLQLTKSKRKFQFKSNAKLDLANGSEFSDV